MHYVDLSPLVELRSYGAVDLFAVFVIAQQGDHGFSSRRQFVNDTDIKVAVYGHCQGTRYGGGCHHQYVGWHMAFAP